MAESLRWMNLSEAKVTETLKNAQLMEKLQRIVELAKNELKNNGSNASATKQQVGIQHIYCKCCSIT